MKSHGARDNRANQILTGIQPVGTALKNKASGIAMVWVARGSRNQRAKDLALLAQDAGIEVREEIRERLDELAGFVRHQDIIAQLYQYELPAESDLLPLLESVSGDPLVLVLDGVQDPHNLGACLRTAEAAGVHAVIIPRDRSVGMTAVVRKTSAGASEVVPLFQVINLARTLRALKKAGIWIAGMSDQSTEALYDCDLSGPLALVLGSEGKGMRRLTGELCDYHLHIPMAGVIESLNVSVASGVCLFEIQRQRKAG